MRLAAAAILIAAFGLTFALDPWQHELVSDVPLYHSYAELFADGVVPYRDVSFEYPPLAAPLIAAPGIFSLELDGYRLLFAGLMLVFGLGLVFSTGRLASLTGGDNRRALLAVALAPVLTGTLIRTHFDLAPVLCVVAGVAAVAAGRTRTGFVVLGVGGALKAFPLLAVPIAAAWLLGRDRKREAVMGVVLAAGAALAAVAAAVVISPDGAWGAVDYHLERPVQIESLPATVLNAVEWAGGQAPESVNSHKSDGLEHSAAGALEAGFALLLLTALVALTLAASRLPDVRGLALTALAATAAFACLGKVLSPQFVVWLVPLAALAWAWRMHALAVCTSAAIAATQLWFPERYFDLVDRQEWPVVAVALRNLLLVAMLVLVAREILRMLEESRAAARSIPPGRRAALGSAPR